MLFVPWSVENWYWLGESVYTDYCTDYTSPLDFEKAVFLQKITRYSFLCSACTHNNYKQVQGEC